MVKAVLKISLFALFLTLIYFVADYFLALLRGFIPSGGFVGGNILPMACQLGVFEGINIFISIMLTAFIVKSIISYIENL